jgi:uncharacterized protein (TIGR02246 family)
VINQTEQLSRIRSAVQAFARQDVATCVQHLGVAVNWSRGDGTTLRGKDALSSQLQDLFRAFPDAALSHVKLLAIPPDGVLVEWDFEGTHLRAWRMNGRSEPVQATGRTARVAGASYVRFETSGEMSGIEARIDTASMFGQLGLGQVPDPAAIRELAEVYTAAWGSQVAPSVASLYALDGRLTVNSGAPAVGRTAIAAVAQGFMTALPDMQVLMDGLHVQADRAVYRRTLTGTNSGPGGTGKPVRISGFEVWRIGADGLIAESNGYFDSMAWLHQLEHGAPDVKP